MRLVEIIIRVDVEINGGNSSSGYLVRRTRYALVVLSAPTGTNTEAAAFHQENTTAKDIININVLLLSIPSA